MQNLVPSEINRPEPGGVLLVGRDPGEHEVRVGRPFVGQSGIILQDALAEAGWRREDVNIANVVGVRPPGNAFGAHNRADVERGISELHDLIQRLAPNVVVTLGNEAAHALIPGWPSRTGTIYGANRIEDRRGYIHEGINGIKVIPTVHPALVARTWVPWRILLGYDLQRAREESHDPRIERPKRDVHIVSDARDALESARFLRSCGYLAADIENLDEREIACVGFAYASDRAIVYPARFLDAARSVLECEQVRTVWQNGQYDLYYLLTRCGIRVANYTDDTILMWHACYPELAGAAEQKRGAKRTQKSLRFLASLYTRDEYWKNYAFESEEERYVLNGRDCCVTYDVAAALQGEVRRQGVHRIYRHEIRLVWPCVFMQQRGLRVDDLLRRTRIGELDARILSERERLRALVVPLLEARADSALLRLFRQRSVCACCRNGAGKREACWSCAGFEKKPGKRALAESGATLASCQVCGGAGAREWWEYNPNSDAQNKILLYDVLKLPKRFKDKHLTTDEEALKGLLGGLNG